MLRRRPRSKAHLLWLIATTLAVYVGLRLLLVALT
jgi:hypothetical protein